MYMNEGNMRITDLNIAGFQEAIQGMRNPKNSWYKSDSGDLDGKFKIGPNDLNLARTLVTAGTEHAKFMRQIWVWADVAMPRYWWSEADTYTFGTKNSCSTMHKLMETDLSLSNFEYEPEDEEYIKYFIEYFKPLRREFHDTKSAKDRNLLLKRAKTLLPEGFIQLRTWNTNYQELHNIYKQRRYHKLTKEWGLFCNWIEGLPYFKELCL